MGDGLRGIGIAKRRKGTSICQFKSQFGLTQFREIIHNVHFKFLNLFSLPNLRPLSRINNKTFNIQVVGSLIVFVVVIVVVVVVIIVVVVVVIVVIVVMVKKFVWLEKNWINWMLTNTYHSF